MAELRQQVQAIIKTCETAMASKKDSELFPDNTTLAIASAILKKAKEQLPNDEVLAAASFDAPVRWSSVLSVMQTVSHSLPLGHKAGLD